MSAPTGPTYNNVIALAEVSLAIEALLVGEANQSWTPAKVDSAKPPSGFILLGATVEDSPQLQVTRDRFQLSTGIPQVLQFQAVRGLKGTFACGFHSNQNRLVAKALGGVRQQKVVVATFGSAVAITSVSGRTEIWVSTVASGSFAVGDFITVGTSGVDNQGLETGDIEGFITAIDATTAQAKITVSSPGFVTTPTTAMKVSLVNYSKIAAGSTRIREHALLGVADFLDGSQVVHLMKRAQATGEWTETIRPEADVTVNTNWDLLAYSDTGYDSGTRHLIVAERFYFPPNA